MLYLSNMLNDKKNNKMKKFNKINLASVVKLNGKEVNVYKFVKAGTKRVFFAPEVEGKRINSTMFSRKYFAEKLAADYIKFTTR